MRQDWPELLAQFIDGRRYDAFAWGARDCVALANDWVSLLRGERIFEASHTTEAEALAEIERRGGLIVAVTEALGPAKGGWKTAQRGDVVLFESGRGAALGVCIGAEFAAQGETGLISFPIDRIIRVWACHKPLPH